MLLTVKRGRLVQAAESASRCSAGEGRIPRVEPCPPASESPARSGSVYKEVVRIYLACHEKTEKSRVTRKNEDFGQLLLL